MSNALEVLKRIVREEYKNIKDGVNIHPSGFRDYTPEEDSDFDEPHSTEKMESVTETIELIKIDNPKYKARLHQVKLAFKLAKVKLTSIKPIKARKGVVPKGHYDKSGDRLAPAWAITATDGKNTKSGEVIFQDGNDPGFYIDKDYMGLNPNNKNKIPRNIQRWMIGKKAHHSKGVNESTKRQYRNVYSKYYKTYEAFAREVMNLAKRVTKISGDRTDERVILKNFKKQVIPFAGLMRSWSRGRESNPHIDESVNKECCDNCKEGKTCCSVTEGKTMKITKTRIKEIIREEIKSVLTEGTRWLVGIEAPSGKIVSTYGHYDGYPEHAGKMLKKYYNNTGKVKQLMKLGKQGISTIDKSMKGGKDHSFNNTKKGETVFYGRDRGQKGSMSSTWGNRDKVKFSSGEEFAYIWSAKDKKWYYKSRYSNPQDWTELK